MPVTRNGGRLTQREILARARAVVEAVRLHLHEYGVRELTAAAVLSVLRILGYERGSDAQRSPFLILSDEGGGGEIRLAARLSETQQLAVLRRILCRLVRGGRQEDADVADVAALYGYFPHRGRVQGAAWTDPRACELAGLAHTWHGRTLSDLARLMESLATKMDPPLLVERDAGGSWANYHEAMRERANGRYPDALALFEAAERGGRAAEAWAVVCLAILGAGVTQRHRGNYRRARAEMQRARATARRHGEREIEGMAVQDLFNLACELGQEQRASRLVRAAYRAYPMNSPRMLRLAHDAGNFWITQGRFTEALPVVLESASRFNKAADRCTAWGSVARAAGGAGNEGTFDLAMVNLCTALAENTEGANAAESMLDLARGAAMLERWGTAGEYGQRALALACRRREGRIIIEAEAFLSAASREERVDAVREAPEPGDELRLARRFVRALRRLPRSAPATDVPALGAGTVVIEDAAGRVALDGGGLLGGGGAVEPSAAG